LNEKKTKKTKEEDDEDASEERQKIIIKIQKYQSSKVFGEYVTKNLKINQSVDKLQKLKITTLNNIISRIRLSLDAENVSSFFDNFAKTAAVAFEKTLTPFYDIDGFSSTLLDNKEFWRVYERLKIETELPQIPPTLQLGYIISGTVLIQHQLNTMSKKKPQVIIVQKATKEMKPPDLHPEMQSIIEELEEI
jgi:hypothetical protein